MGGVFRNKKAPYLLVCGPLLRGRKWESGLYDKGRGFKGDFITLQK
jgi:hypothetical protein